MRRWLVTAAALTVAAGITAILLWYGNPDRGAVEAYVLTRDVPAGGVVGLDAVRAEAVRLAPGVRPPLGPGAEARLESAPAAHDLAAGQLLQAADLSGGASAPDRRLVVLPVKDAPPIAPGDRVDLLLVTGGDRTTVTPFVFGLEVRAVTPAGLVVVASSRAAAGLVYVAQTEHLVAVAGDRSTHTGQETQVSSLDEAVAAARP